LAVKPLNQGARVSVRSHWIYPTPYRYLGLVMTANPIKPSSSPARSNKSRMSGVERREQIVGVARGLFAEKGYESVTVEEIAAVANVSKPVIYEHFGGKDGIYAVIVDRELNRLIDLVSSAFDGGGARSVVQGAAEAFFQYIEESEDGFRILVRDAPTESDESRYASLIRDFAAQTEDLLAAQLTQNGFDKETAPLYAHALVGMVSLTGQWWLDAPQRPNRETVVAHLVNLAWNGLKHLEPQPKYAK
jgi:AcrR family transcriptional regulator